ncbi:phage head closure protein [Kurthia massiliensis]|uniref:phage head closure protein n=1 Tax=Kurthia massiliensis TaxID=1033739 RepID=UPI0002899B94|nr:phage head closure protein [Kurthia massiliensis]
MSWKPLNNLNKRITFVSIQQTQDDIGDTIEVETNVLSVWAAIKSVQAEEIKGAIGTIAKRNIVFLVRSDNPDLQQVENYMSVKYKENTYEIDFINWADEQSGFYTEVWCSL